MTKSIYVTTPTGRKEILPDLFTGATFYPKHGFFLAIHHGGDHYADTFFTAEEGRLLMDNCGRIQSCHRGRNGGCWAQRQTDAVPEKCIRCAIARVFLEQGAGDFRLMPQRSENPLKLPVVVACSLAWGTWILAAGYSEAYTIEHRARVRAESRLATFERQGRGKR